MGDINVLDDFCDLDVFGDFFVIYLFTYEKEKRGNIYYIQNVLQITIVHSTPSSSGDNKSASGRRLVIITALRRIR